MFPFAIINRMPKKQMLDTVKLDEAPEQRLRLTHLQEMLAIFLAFIILFAFTTKHQGGSWNDQSRFATMEALVENPPNMPAFAIDYTTYGWWTGDKIYDGKHFYSTKPPVLSVIGAGIYYCLFHWFGMDYSDSRYEGLIYFLITFILMAIPTSVMFALFYDLMRRMGLSKPYSLFLTIALGLGSFYLPYTTVFNNHTFAGVSMFAAFYFLFRAIEHRGTRGWNLFFSGLFSGLGVTVDILGAIPLAVAFLLYTASMGLNKGWYRPVSVRLLLWGPLIFLPFITRFITNRKVRWLGFELWGSFILGMLIFVTIHLYLNIQITGSLKPIYSNQALYTKLAVEGYYGEVIKSGAGLFSEVRLRYIINSILGIRGIFFYTPLLLFCLYFTVRVALDSRSRLARLALYILVFLIPSWIYLLFETKNYGGTSYGSRYFIAPQPMLFFFCCYMYRYAAPAKIKGWFYEAFRFSVLMSVIGMSFPWGVAGDLPASNFSLFNNLQYCSQNFLSVFAQLIAGNYQ